MIKGLPEKLRTLRKQYGFSQREAASRLGISTSVISAYENGERTPSTENLLALSYLYKCSTDYLLGRETDPLQIASLNGHLCHIWRPACDLNGGQPRTH